MSLRNVVVAGYTPSDRRLSQSFDLFEFRQYSHAASVSQQSFLHSFGDTFQFAPLNSIQLSKLIKIGLLVQWLLKSCCRLIGLKSIVGEHDVCQAGHEGMCLYTVAHTRQTNPS